MKKYLSTTKANYRRDSRKSLKLGLLISALVIGMGLLFPWFITKVSAIVLYPFHATSTWVKSSDGPIAQYLRSKDSLVKEIETLKSKIATETGTQMSIKRLVEENMQLRSMVKSGAGEDRIIARVLARPGQLSYDLLQIDKGIRDGVIEGASVYTGIDSVLGVVAYAADTYAFVELFTSPGFMSTAFIFGPNVFASLEGNGGGIARVKLPQGVGIKEGQLVILPGVSSAVYGEIAYVENEPTQPEQYGYIAPPLAMNNLLYVSVGKEVIEVKNDIEIDQMITSRLKEAYKLSTTSTYMYTPEVLEEPNLGEATSTVELPPQ